MTPEDRDKCMKRLLAIWPTPHMPDPTRLSWVDFLTPLDGDRTARAFDALQKTSPRRPAQSDLWGAYQAAGGPARYASAPDCGVCGGEGWVNVVCEDPRCVRPDHTVTRCPHGCLPPSHEQLEAIGRAADARWRREHRDRDLNRRVDVVLPDLRLPTDSADRREAEEAF